MQHEELYQSVAALGRLRSTALLVGVRLVNAVYCYAVPQGATESACLATVLSVSSLLTSFCHQSPALVLRIRAQWQDGLAVGVAGSGRFPALEMMRCLRFANLSVSQNHPEGWLKYG